MFVVRSKLLGFFAIPSNLVFLIGIGGLLLLPTASCAPDGGLAFGGLVVLAIRGFSPIGNALITLWRNRFPPWDHPPPPPLAPDGITRARWRDRGFGSR